MKANKQGSRRFFGPVVALLLLVGVTVTAMPSTPTLAGQPEPPIPQPEPFCIRLDQPLAGAGVAGEAVSVSQVRVTADPGTWYNLMAEEFDGDIFPPANWSVVTQSGAGWAKHNEQHVSGDYSAGVVATTTGTLGTWLFYGGETGFSLQGVADAELHFNYWLDTEKDAVYFGWAASPDGQNFYGARTSGRVTSQWLTGVLDMRQYIGDDAVWIAFFVMGQATTGEQHVYVDNVVVRGMEPFKAYLPVTTKNYKPPATTFTFTDNFGDVNSGWPKKVVNWDPYKQHIYGYTDKLVADYPSNYDIIGGACREHAGTYFMRVGDATHGYKVIAKAPVQVEGQFTLEADIAFCDEAHNASAGVVFGLNDAQDEYYRVILIHDAVDNTTKYAIWRDTSHQLVSTSGFGHLKGGYETNHIKVMRDECTISVYFNDHLATTLTNECYYRDRRWAGLFHDMYSYYGLTGTVVDNFVVEGALQP